MNETMEQHIGEVIVRLGESTHFIVKARIIGFEGRTEANLRVSKEKLKVLGITTLKRAKIALPLLKNLILEEINQQFPEFWELD